MLAKKARSRLAALRRLRFVLDDNNMKTMYIMFVRSVMEYGNVVYMGAADSHLNKLDRIQRSDREVHSGASEPLKCRREAAAISLALKLLEWTAEGEADCKTTHPNSLTSRQPDFRDIRAMG